MIPYLQIPPFALGPVTFYPFGLLAATSVVVGLWYAYRVAERDLGAGGVLLDMAPWFLLAGFLGAHLVSLVFYFPDRVHDRDFWTLINVTAGLSSFGGLFGGALGAWLFIHRHQQPLLPWLDVLSRGFAVAYIPGRTGCALVHDHPGVPTDFLLAVDYPERDGFPAGPRHDLGLYELVFWVALTAVFHRLARQRWPDGLYLGVLIVLYTPVRFGLDFLRTNDLTHHGLTFAQWSCLATAPVGVWLLWRCAVRPKITTALPEQR